MDLTSIDIVTLNGQRTTFGELSEGKITLLVNVASRCGLAPQYEQLEHLQRTYGDSGFTVIGFPSNQFLQENGNAEQIAEYCSTNWGVSFPMTEKGRVNGKHAHELYRKLKQVPDGKGNAGRIIWNFEKFLINPDGRIKRFRPTTRPDAPEVVNTIKDWIREAEKSQHKR